MHTFELPSGLEIELREMTGAEEELLTNQRLIRTGDAVNQALKNSIVRLGDNDEPTVKDVLDLLSGDRLFVLVRLRQISLGDEVELELTCPNTACRAANAVTVNSEELEVTPTERNGSSRSRCPVPGARSGSVIWTAIRRNAWPHSKSLPSPPPC